MKLSIVILNYNVRYFLELCLQSVEAAVKTIDAEIIVIDNNSQDDSCAMIKQKFPQVKLIENDKNSGFSRGNNIAVAQAQGKFICILNPDTVVAEDTFLKMLGFAEQQKDFGAIGCRLIDGRGQFLPESKRNIPVVRVAFQKMLGNANNYYANHLEAHENGKIDILVGAFMFMKREVYQKVNGFDEDYFMYGEDVDISYKILKAGYKNYYLGETTIIHYKGESTLKDEKYAKRFYGAMQIFYKKHFRRNIIFDALVYMGIRFAKMFRNVNFVKEQAAKHHVFLTQDRTRRIKFPFEVTTVETLQDIKPHTEIIFDANTLSYKTIIQHISNLEKNGSLTFKILPKNSTFIIGSNHSKNRGSILPIHEIRDV